MSKLSELYSAHNRLRREGFVYGGAERLAAFSRLVPRSCRRLLDIGCRDGTLVSALGVEGSIIGLDIDIDALRLATDAKILKGCVGDLWHNLPFGDTSFDVVLAGEVLEHLPFPQWLLGEMARVLVTGGIAVGSVPNAFRLKNRFRVLTGRAMETDATHLRQFSVSSLRAALADHFGDIAITPCVGRFASTAGSLMANTLVWTGRKVG